MASDIIIQIIKNLIRTAASLNNRRFQMIATFVVLYHSDFTVNF